MKIDTENKRSRGTGNRPESFRWVVMGSMFSKDLLNCLKEGTGSLTVQRSSKGALAIASIGHNGENVVIENTTSGARAKNQSLKGYQMIRNANGKDTVNVALKDFDLKAGQKYTVWAKGAKTTALGENEQVADYSTFGVGSCVWKLVDDTGSEKATLNAKFNA